MQCSEPQGGGGRRKGGNGGSEGRKVASIASLLPVGSAKFGPRVGGLVSPALVGAGVPVGTRVGAAHTRTVRVQLLCPEQPPQCWRTGALLRTRYSALEYPSSTRRAAQAKSPSVRCRSPTLEYTPWCRTHALHCVPSAHERGGIAHRARVSTLGVP